MRLHRGRTYRAPEALWGRSIRLVDGRSLTVGPDGFARLAGTGSGCGPRVEALWEEPIAGFKLRPCSEFAGLVGRRSAGPLLGGRMKKIDWTCFGNYRV